MKNDKLRKARKDRRLTQKALAEQVGVETISVRKWEDGTRNPSAECRLLLCQILEKTEEQLGLGNNSFRPVQTDRNLLSLMKRVDTRWISGVLAHSLSQGTLIPLHLREQPDAILNPWAEMVQEPNPLSQPLSVGTPITQVYDNADGSLLLLGNSGAGKTTLLLELARDLIERAKADETHPIPVVFNLSSWTQNRPSLQDWMIEDLNSKYQVPHHLAEEWVTANQILPLLDGLDEVAEPHRQKCIETINAYRKEHGFLPMIVSCRTPEYLALSDRLALGKAIVIEPLSWEEIKSYISKVGKSLEGVKIALKSDQGLREMASTPLMLHIMAQTFPTASIDDILSTQNPEARRRLIFEKYLEVVLKRREQKSRYTAEQTIHWLAWLAEHLKQQNQTEFYLERMQPDWLPNDHTRGRYRNMVIRLIFGLNTVVLCALFALFRGDSVPSKPGLFSWLGATGKGSELLEWMRPGLGGGLAGASSLDLLMVVISSLIAVIVNMRIIPTLSLKTARIGLLRGLRNGLFVGGPVTVFSGLIQGFCVYPIVPKDQKEESSLL